MLLRLPQRGQFQSTADKADHLIGNKSAKKFTKVVLTRQD